MVYLETMDKRKLIRSFGYAMEGIRVCIQEQNFKIHLIAAVVVLVAGALTKLAVIEWIILCMMIGLVLMAEMLNTAIEKVVDLASPDIHPLAKAAKDVAAGAVLVIALFSVIIGILIFIPKWIRLF